MKHIHLIQIDPISVLREAAASALQLEVLENNQNHMSSHRIHIAAVTSAAINSLYMPIIKQLMGMAYKQVKST